MYAYYPTLEEAQKVCDVVNMVVKVPGTYDQFTQVWEVGGMFFVDLPDDIIDSLAGKCFKHPVHGEVLITSSAIVEDIAPFDEEDFDV